MLILSAIVIVIVVLPSKEDKLIDAVKERNLPEVERILKDSRVNINIKTGENGLSPLMLAALNNDMPIVSLLLKKGANVNLKNDYGFYLTKKEAIEGEPPIPSQGIQ